MVALVDDDEAIVFEEFVGSFLAGDALDHGNVDGSGWFVLPAADHADVVVVEAEVFAETLAPLGEQWFAVDQDEGWLSVVGDDGAGGDRFAGAWWCDDHGEVVVDDGVEGGLLVGEECAGEVEVDVVVLGS